MKAKSLKHKIKTLNPMVFVAMAIAVVVVGYVVVSGYLRGDFIKFDREVTEIVSGENLTLKYPSDWSLDIVDDNNTDKGDPNQKITITSPDKKTRVYFSASVYAGFGGTGEEMKLDYIKSYRLSNYSKNELIKLVQTIDGKYYLSTFVRPLTDEDKLGDNKESLRFAGIPLSNGNLNIITIDSELGDGGFSSLDAAKKALDSRDFRIATRIVQSIYNKSGK